MQKRISSNNIFFHVQNNHLDGFTSQCKKCRAIAAKKYRQKNIDKINKKRKKYYESNKEKYLKQCKQYYKLNKNEKLKKARKRYHKKTKHQTLQHQKEWYKSKALYNGMAFQKIIPYQETRQNPNKKSIGQIRCAYCGKWYSPTNLEIKNRCRGLVTTSGGEGNIYCSESCKQACPVFKKVSWPDGFKKASSREVNPYTRQLCFEKDGYTCQKCGANGSKIQLHCHHIKTYTLNKILGNDIDNVITLCKACHKTVHKYPGCTYYESRCFDDAKHAA